MPDGHKNNQAKSSKDTTQLCTVTVYDQFREKQLFLATPTGRKMFSITYRCLSTTENYSDAHNEKIRV